MAYTRRQQKDNDALKLVASMIIMLRGSHISPDTYQAHRVINTWTVYQRLLDKCVPAGSTDGLPRLKHTNDFIKIDSAR